MTMHEQNQSTNPMMNRSRRAHIVYDLATGEVLHTHYSVDGHPDAPVREEAANRAMRLAGNGRSADVLEVEPSEIPRNKRFKVDARARRLVVLGDSQ